MVVGVVGEEVVVEEEVEEEIGKETGIGIITKAVIKIEDGD